MLETEPLFCFHHVNAFEVEDGRVIMDCLAMRGGVDFGANFGNLSAEFFQRAPWRTALTRLTLDPNSRRVRNSTNPMRWICPAVCLCHCTWHGRASVTRYKLCLWICMPTYLLPARNHFQIEVQQDVECLLHLLLATNTPEPQQLAF